MPIGTRYYARLDPRATFEEICARSRLTVVERLSVTDGGADFLAHVVDHTGTHRLLKRNSGLRGHGEITLLQAWEATGVVLSIIEVIDEDTFIGDWIEGTTLDRSQRAMDSLLRECGAAFRKLHTAAPPSLRLMPIRERASGAWLERDLGALPEPWMRARAEEAAASLCDYEDAEAVVLHGDAVPVNILVSERGLVIIDPIGFSGPPAWDLAQLSIAVEGSDRRESLKCITDGYGFEPRHCQAAFAHFAFMFLSAMSQRDRANAGSHTAVVAELSSLVAGLR